MKGRGAFPCRFTRAAAFSGAGQKGGVVIEEKRIISGRDVAVSIDGKRVFCAEKIEIRKKAVIHRIRSVFRNDDIGRLRVNSSYKADLTGIRFVRPFENLNFSDLDNFTLETGIDGTRIILEGCLWDDYYAAADKKSFSEHISVAAAEMRTEDENEGDTA